MPHRLLVAGAIVVTAALSAVCRQGVKPTFQYVGSGACADLLAHAWSEDHTEQLAVDIDREKLRLPLNGTHTIKIEDAGEGLDIRVQVFERETLLTSCSDVLDSTQPKPAVWRGTSGVLTVELSPAIRELQSPTNDFMYDVRMTLQELVVRDANGNVAAAPETITLRGKGGWVPG